MLKEMTEKIVMLDMIRPYDFILCLRAIASYEPNMSEQLGTLRLATRIEGTPTLIEIRQVGKSRGKIIATSIPEASEHHVRPIAEWVLFAELDLAPFYLLTSKEPKLAPIMRKLHGLKPMRPMSLFQMAIIDIIEQHIPLAAAHHCVSRLVQRYGECIDDVWIFPEPSALSKATHKDLRSCGLSRQKAQYVQELAANIVYNSVNLDVLKTMDDDKVRETIKDIHGFGPRSADNIILRGLARPDCVPLEDAGIQSVVGEYLGGGQRLSSSEVIEKLDPFRPYRGLLAFYLLVAHRLKITPPIGMRTLITSNA